MSVLLKSDLLKYFKFLAGLAAIFAISSLISNQFKKNPSSVSNAPVDIVSVATTTDKVAPSNPFMAPSETFSGNPAMTLPLDQLTESLAKKLEKNPKDIAGWTLLARSYATLGQKENSRKAFDKAVTFAPGDVNLRIVMGETLMSAAQDKITPEAKKSFLMGESIDPKHPGVRYYLALSDYQEGKLQEAHDAWSQLLKETPADAPWHIKLEKKLAEAALKLDAEPTQ
jgi:cytochrome c-type biogenesis protein CcmH